MEICSKQSGVILVSNKPNFKYKFKESGVPLDVKKEHVDKVLSNPNFYEKKTVKKKEVKEE